MKRLVQIPRKYLRNAHQEQKDGLTEIEDFKRRFIALLDWVKEDEEPDKKRAVPWQEICHKNISR